MSKCLFVMQGVGIGGTSTSLLNLLSLYDEGGVKHDVFLFNHDGVFASEIAEVSNLLPEDKLLAAASCTKANLKKRGIMAYVRRIKFVLSCRIHGIRKARELLYKKCASRLSGKYDTVIAYQEDLTTDFVHYVKCNNKVAWCHMDFLHVQNVSKRGDGAVRQIYSTFDKIVCVSDVIRNSMIGKVDLPADKITVVYNTMPPKMIHKKAQSSTDDVINKRKFTFVSMGRFEYRKRFDRVVLDFIWYLLGNGDEFEKIRKDVEEKGLSEHLVLTGAKSNPFVYLKEADCFVMSSENEGQPMVLNEALTLGIPVITSDFPSAREVVGDFDFGVIVPNDDCGIGSGVLKFTEDEALRQKMKIAANNFVYDNNKIIAKVDELISI